MHRASRRLSTTQLSTVTLRPVRSGDEGFLLSVYASTREEELAQVDWSEDQKQAFVLQQFRAQDRHYREHYTGAEYLVIEVEGEPAGRLYVVRWDDEIRIMDIALLREFRNRGIGSHLLGGLIEESRRSGKPLTIHVERFNPALALYQRLGFKPVEDEGVYLLMRWSA